MTVGVERHIRGRIEAPREWNYGTFVPWNFRSQEPSFRGTFVPKSEIYMELSFPNSKIIILY